jgi:hypothetical protein
MELRTRVACRSNRLRITHTQHILSLGSCFAEYMAARLTVYRFTVCSNPTGTLYNPLSIASTIDRIESRRLFCEHELFEHEGVWSGYAHHSRFDAPNPEACLATMNQSLVAAIDAFNRMQTCIITFGTAFVYREKSAGFVVTNCHGLPHDRFTRSLAPIDEIVRDCNGFLSRLYAAKPGLNVILSVSPVRHLRDDAHENQVSKAHLIAAIHELQAAFPALYYFPAFEIVMDELRDYRFYAADLVHPSETAISYIWQRFQEACLDASSRQFISRYTPILTARNHTVSAPWSAKARSFARAQTQEVHALQQAYPGVNFSDDLAYFSAML